MAISAALCNSYKREILQGIHLSTDVYRMALYSSSASLSKSTTAYTIIGEVSGMGYTAGGNVLAGFSTGLDGDTAYLDWTSDPSWPGAFITARGALIYNASQANRAVAVLDFGAEKVSTNGTFLVSLPTPDALNALIRIA